MLGHRTLNLEDYLFILKRRLWIVAIPALLFPILAYMYSYTIPSQYVSQTLILIDQQSVPSDYVQPLISQSMDSRLASMKEQIFSRSRIQPIIEKFDLYGKEGSMDDRVDRARKNISIMPIHSQIAHSGGLPGFFISFTAGDAHTAQIVCGEITTLFLNENLRATEDASSGTFDFLKGQLEDAKKNLDEQDAKLAAFQRQYSGKLPGEETSSVQMLTTLNTQLEATTQQLARMEQDRDYAKTMLAQQTPPPVIAAPGEPARPQVSAASVAQQVEMQKLLAQEAELTAHYTADYPDVVAIRRAIADQRRKMIQGPSPSNNSPAVAAAQARAQESPAVQQLRAQIHALDGNITQMRQEQGSIQNAVRVYQDRISSSPMVQEQYKQLTRDYQTALAFHDDLLSKMNRSKMAIDLDKRQGGEHFHMMDAPNLPEAPTYPKRPIFAMAGLGGGLAFGLLIVGILEYRDTALRTERDVWAFTKLPTLAVIALTLDGVGTPSKSSFFRRWKSAPQVAAK